jgi:hypothetical protein
MRVISLWSKQSRRILRSRRVVMRMGRIRRSRRRVIVMWRRRSNQIVMMGRQMAR